MKVDVEGDEVLVLRGALGLLLRKRVHAVMLEVHCGMLRSRGEDPWEAPRILRDLGFDIEVRGPLSLGFVDRASFEAAERRVVAERRVSNLQLLATLPPTLW